MKKVAIVLGQLGTHGPSLIRIQIATELANRGFKVDLVLGSESSGFKDKIPSFLKVHILYAVRPREFILKLKSYLNSEKPDGVIASSWPYSVSTIIAVRLFARGTNVVVSEHADFRTNIESSGEFSSKDAWLIKNISRYIYNRADKVVGVSQGVVDGLIAVAGINREKTTTIYNPLRVLNGGVALPVEEQRLRDQFWSPNSVKILAVGRLALQKDYGVMLKALSLLKNKGNFKLIIVGDGSLRSHLQEKAVRFGVDDIVLFAGATHSVSDYYENADLFLMSSSSEGFGNVIVEALSFGLPVVSTDCQSGPAEILDFGKYGILTPVGDAEALAAGIKQAVTSHIDPEKQKERSKHFSIENAVDQYLSALFQDIRS